MVGAQAHDVRGVGDQLPVVAPAQIEQDAARQRDHSRRDPDRGKRVALASGSLKLRGISHSGGSLKCPLVDDPDRPSQHVAPKFARVNLGFIQLWSCDDGLMGVEASKFIELNRDLWDKRVRAHLGDGLYPSDEVEAGTYVVGLPDVVEVGDVSGRRLLHVQCNAGADTLYWARQGATVVGVDFSVEAIIEARRLAAVTGLAAEFVCSDVYEIRGHDLGLFDIIYTSMGVLWWLPDLTAWAQVVADHLAAGGFFYINEIHPFAMTLADRNGQLVVATDYFGSMEPLVFETTGTYYDAADDFAAEPATECGWVHTLGEVVTSLSQAGLRVEYLREHRSTGFRMLRSFVQDDRGMWHPPEGQPRLPLTFSLLAHR